MNPQYFMHSLTLAEANDYIKGQDRRARGSWEQTRVIVNTLIGIMGGEAPEWTFPWEEKTPEEKAADAAKEAEDFKHLEELAAYYTQLEKDKKNKQ